MNNFRQPSYPHYDKETEDAKSSVVFTRANKIS